MNDIDLITPPSPDELQWPLTYLAEIGYARTMFTRQVYLKFRRYVTAPPFVFRLYVN